MTGSELKELMEREEIPFTLVKIRIQCIMNRTYAMIAIRQWIRDNADLPTPVTREGLLHSHFTETSNKGMSIFA